MNGFLSALYLMVIVTGVFIFIPLGLLFLLLVSMLVWIGYP